MCIRLGCPFVTCLMSIAFSTLMAPIILVTIGEKGIFPLRIFLHLVSAYFTALLIRLSICSYSCCCSLFRCLFCSASLKICSIFSCSLCCKTCCSSRFEKASLTDGILDVVRRSIGGGLSSLLTPTILDSAMSIHSHLWSLGEQSKLVYPPLKILIPDVPNIPSIVSLPLWCVLGPFPYLVMITSLIPIFSISVCIFPLSLFRSSFQSPPTTTSCPFVWNSLIRVLRSESHIDNVVSSSLIARFAHSRAYCRCRVCCPCIGLYTDIIVVFLSLLPCKVTQFHLPSLRLSLPSFIVCVVPMADVVIPVPPSSYFPLSLFCSHEYLVTKLSFQFLIMFAGLSRLASIGMFSLCSLIPTTSASACL